MCIWIRCPIGCNSNIFCRHCSWNSSAPSSKLISSLCWIRWCCYCSIIILCNWLYFCSTICIKCNCILIYSPLSRNSHTCCWHCCWNIFIPTRECISSFSWISWWCNFSTIILSDWFYFCSTICIKCNCILIYSPSSINCPIFSRHCCWNIFIPTRECISSPCWITWLCNRCSIFISNWRNCCSTICIKCNCIRISFVHIINYCTSIWCNCSSLSCWSNKSYICFYCWFNFTISSSI